jgi:hypothetical protein
MALQAMTPKWPNSRAPFMTLRAMPGAPKKAPTTRMRDRGFEMD